MHWLFNLFLFLATPAVALKRTGHISGDYVNPIVNLGASGTYRGVLQNNGTWVIAIAFVKPFEY